MNDANVDKITHQMAVQEQTPKKLYVSRQVSCGACRIFQILSSVIWVNVLHKALDLILSYKWQPTSILFTFGFLLPCCLLATDVNVPQQLYGSLRLGEEVKGKVKDEQGEGFCLSRLAASRHALLMKQSIHDERTSQNSSSCALTIHAHITLTSIPPARVSSDAIVSQHMTVSSEATVGQCKFASYAYDWHCIHNETNLLMANPKQK